MAHSTSQPTCFPPDTAVVIPALGMQPALDFLLGAIPPGLDVYLVDDGSWPPLEARAVTIIRHSRNRGYGAAQKTGYQAALDGGAGRVVLLHGDAQYDVADTLALALALDFADVATGSRFLDSPPPGLPAWRSLGIRALTSLANLRLGTSHSDLHNGARAFRAGLLRRLGFQDFSDDYLFDHQLMCAAIRAGARLVERPVRMKYGGDVLSISPGRALRYGLGCLRSLL